MNAFVIFSEHENMEDILLGRILLMKAYDDELFAKIEQGMWYVE